MAVYRALRLARAFDTEATDLVMQGQPRRLPVLARAGGVPGRGGALRWTRRTGCFPTYRDTAALAVRGIDPVEALTLLRGAWHCGYDPKRWRTAPQCTPLATQAPHAVGLGLAAKLAGDPVVALCLLRRRRDQRGRLPRGLQQRGRVSGPGGLPGAEQPVRDLGAAA